MQALWSETDKNCIEKMTCKAKKIAAKFEKPVFTSSDESSESDLESCASFVAVPREFRPPQQCQGRQNTPRNNSKPLTHQSSKTLHFQESQHRISQGNVQQNHNQQQFPGAWDACGQQPASSNYHNNVEKQTGCISKHKKIEHSVLKDVKTDKFLDMHKTDTQHEEETKNQAKLVFPKPKNFKRPTYLYKITCPKYGNKNKYPFCEKISEESETKKTIWNSSLDLSNGDKSACEEVEKLNNAMDATHIAKTPKIKWKVKTFEPKLEKTTKKEKINYQIKKREELSQTQNFIKNEMGQLNRVESDLKQNKQQKRHNKTQNQSSNMENFVNGNRITLNNRPTKEKLLTKQKIEMKVCPRECNFTENASKIWEAKQLPRIGEDTNLQRKNEATQQGCYVKELADHSEQQMDEKVLVNLGKDIADVIVGSHIAFNTLYLVYNEWQNFRQRLIEQFQQLKNNMKAYTKDYSNYKELLAHANTLASLTGAFPHLTAGMISKVVSTLTGVFKYFINNSKTNDSIKDVPDIIGILIGDKQLLEELHMHGLQCNMQFKEAIAKIEEFHNTLSNKDYKYILKFPDILKFLDGVQEYTPKHHTFYYKLHQCYQELLNEGTVNSRRFCEPLFLYEQNATEIIKYLNWNFVEKKNSDVEEEIREIHNLIQSNGPTNLKDIFIKIEKCILKLDAELQSVKRCMEKIPIFKKFD